MFLDDNRIRRSSKKDFQTGLPPTPTPPPTTGDDMPNFVTLIASQVISSGMVVIINEDGTVSKFDYTAESNMFKECGIAKTSTSAGGQSIDVFIFGIATVVGSGWIAGKVYYVGTNALLTLTPPATGIVKVIGTGMDTNSLLMKMDGLEIIKAD